VKILRISHKGLRRFAETGKPKGVMQAERLRGMLAFIAAAETIEDLSAPPNYGLHSLSGDRAGDYAMIVTRNWRLTFTLVDEGTIADLDLEDYH
jgi:proteic killer suppression protein